MKFWGAQEVIEWCLAVAGFDDFKDKTLFIAGDIYTMNRMNRRSVFNDCLKGVISNKNIGTINCHSILGAFNYSGKNSQSLAVEACNRLLGESDILLMMDLWLDSKERFINNLFNYAVVLGKDVYVVKGNEIEKV